MATQDKTKQKLPRLLVGDQSFRLFIGTNAPFVDKTGMIRELISESPGPYFLVRPRRFGKTLLLDTIRNIFEGNRKLFKDLEIGRDKSRKTGYDWQRFPVVHISFNGYPSDPGQFQEVLVSALNGISGSHGLPTGEITTVSGISNVIERLSEAHPVSRQFGLDPKRKTDRMNVVLLIDEYDYPLISNIGDAGKTEELRTGLHDFYSSVKSCYEYLRFSMVVGVTKFTQLSMFSGMNNFKDISLDERYAAICGFTEDEITGHFSTHLLEMLDHLKTSGYYGEHCTVLDIMADLKDWYDGYTWDGSSRVFNPYSVMSCLNSKSFGHYWYMSGQPLLTSKLWNENETYFKMFSKQFSFSGVIPELDMTDINDSAAIFQGGYLTVESIDLASGIPEYRLKCPNNEVSHAIIQEFIARKGILTDGGVNINSKYGSLVDAFDSLDEDTCSFLFSSCISETASHLNTHAELVPHVMLYTLLNVKGQRASMEVNLGDGRADLMYRTPDGIFVIEIKYDRPGRDLTPEQVSERLDGCVAEAFRQIDERQYAKPNFVYGRNIYAVAVGVHGYSDAKIRFRRKIYRDGIICDIDPAGDI
ncbi:MAG: ATP-binding protein [Deltaproteobacteria bacterium]|jgi:hypothetical protein|nr:ATP-binding protein [Deltaproteobacteria bacterium]